MAELKTTNIDGHLRATGSIYTNGDKVSVEGHTHKAHEVDGIDTFIDNKLTSGKLNISVENSANLNGHSDDYFYNRQQPLSVQNNTPNTSLDEYYKFDTPRGYINKLKVFMSRQDFIVNNSLGTIIINRDLKFIRNKSLLMRALIPTRKNRNFSPSYHGEVFSRGYIQGDNSTFLEGQHKPSVDVNPIEINQYYKDVTTIDRFFNKELPYLEFFNGDTIKISNDTKDLLNQNNPVEFSATYNKNTTGIRNTGSLSDEEIKDTDCWYFDLYSNNEYHTMPILPINICGIHVDAALSLQNANNTSTYILPPGSAMFLNLEKSGSGDILLVNHPNPTVGLIAFNAQKKLVSEDVNSVFSTANQYMLGPEVTLDKIKHLKTSTNTADFTRAINNGFLELASKHADKLIYTVKYRDEKGTLCITINHQTIRRSCILYDRTLIEDPEILIQTRAISTNDISDYKYRDLNFKLMPISLDIYLKKILNLIISYTDYNNPTDRGEDSKLLDLSINGLSGSINGVPFDGFSDITITAKANGGNTDTINNLTVDNFVLTSKVGNEANKIPVFSDKGRLVFPSGDEEWIG